MPELPRSRRRWFSFSLRASLLLVLVVGGLMGWKARRASLQRRAVARIERLGGSVVYDWKYAGNAYLMTPATSPAAPAWLRRVFGDEYFQEVAQVNLPAQIPFGPAMGQGPDALEEWAQASKAFKEKWIKPLDDDQLACIDELDQLDSLIIQWDGKLKPDGLARLERLVRLKELHFSKTLDTESLACLGHLTNIETLSISVDWQEGCDLTFLERMPKLRSLVVTGPISDANLAQIGRERKLESLTFMGTKLTGEGLAHLKNLKSLKYLSIMGATQLAGEDHLEGLTNLENLFLLGARLNDVGLEHLRKLPKLANLAIWKGQISDQAIEEFKAARPAVSLSVSP